MNLDPDDMRAIADLLESFNTVLNDSRLHLEFSKIDIYDDGECLGSIVEERHNFYENPYGYKFKAA